MPGIELACGPAVEESAASYRLELDAHHGKRAVTPGMAMRLARVLGVSMQTWLNLQAAVDIYDALHSPAAREIAKLKPLRTAS